MQRKIISTVTESSAGQSVTDRHVTILLLQDLYYDMVCDFFFFLLLTPIYVRQKPHSPEVGEKKITSLHMVSCKCLLYRKGLS